jgi:hypothetical protein
MAKLPVDEVELHRLLRQVEEVEGSGRILATLLYEVGSAFYYQARYPAAEPFFRRSLAIEEQNFGLDHPNVARASTNSRSCSMTPTELRKPSCLAAVRWRSWRRRWARSTPMWLRASTA